MAKGGPCRPVWFSPCGSSSVSVPVVCGGTGRGVSWRRWAVASLWGISLCARICGEGSPLVSVGCALPRRDFPPCFLVGPAPVLFGRVVLEDELDPFGMGEMRPVEVALCAAREVDVEDLETPGPCLEHVPAHWGASWRWGKSLPSHLVLVREPFEEVPAVAEDTG